MPYKDPEVRRSKAAEYQRKWYAKNRAQHLAAVAKSKSLRVKRLSDFANHYKTSRGCKDCGYNEHAVAMDFDHLRDKEHNVSSLVTSGFAFAIVVKEMMKCEVVCANCHRVRTQNRKNP